jgi:integrase/recombinase XerD
MNLTDFEKARATEDLWIRGEEKIFERGIPRQGKVEAKPITINEAWQKFLGQARARKLSQTSIYKYDLLRRRMGDFAKRQELYLLRDCNTDVLELFQSEWKGGDVTLSKALERLKSFCRAAFLRKWIDENPALTLRGPKPKPRPTLPFTQDEMTRILAAIDKYRDKSRRTGQANALRLRAFVLTLRYTGMRLGDVAALSTDRLIGNKILLYTQKTGVPVYCVLPQFVADLLECLPRISDRYFFWTGNSTPHTVNGIFQRTLKSLFNLAEIKHAHAHRFRDTFSVELLLAGVPIEQVSVLLGHSDIRITQLHYDPWVRDRQLQLEADLQRAWNRDPIVLLNSKAQAAERRQPTLPN